MKSIVLILGCSREFRFALRSALFVLLGAALPSACGQDDKPMVAGIWSGEIFGPRSIGLAIKLERNLDKWAGTALVPTWGDREWPLDVKVAPDGRVALRLPSGGYAAAEFDCKLRDDVLKGSYHFRDKTFVVSFHRGGDPSKLQPRHPQVPGSPVGYREVRLNVPAGENILTGVIYLPDGHGRCPACVIVPGSRPQQVDIGVPGNIFVQGQTFFEWVLSDFLVRHGIVVAHLNSRGSGGSTGQFENATIDGLAADVSATVHFLQNMPEVDASRVGAIGFSQGGAVAPLAASKDRNISFLILLAPPGIPGGEIFLAQSEKLNEFQLREQNDRFLRRHPTGDHSWMRQANEESMAYLAKNERTMVDLLKKSMDTESILAQMTLQDGALNDPDVKNDLLRRLRKLSTPLERSSLNYDPVPAFEKLQQTPILVLHGDLDYRIQPAKNIPRIEGALRRAGNESTTIKTFAGLGHSFVRIPSDDPWGDRDSVLSIDPAVLNFLEKWISDNVEDAKVGARKGEASNRK